MYISEDLVEQVRAANDIVDVISGYVRLQKKGNNYFGLCPFHNEKNPSFSVNRDKQMYYCFGCGAGGNVFTFLMEYERYTFAEAFNVLAQRAGIEAPEGEFSYSDRQRADLRESLFKINKDAGIYFYRLLRSGHGERALKYLTDRALNARTINSFGLGYADRFYDDLYRHLKGRGYSDTLISKSGLVTVDGKNGPHDKFWNRVMFPIMDVRGRVIAFGGRVMGEGEPKYLNSPETEIFEKRRNLYGLNIARTSKEDSFILCEGYMDVISLHQAGFTNAVASLGTALTESHAPLIRRYVKNVYLAYDSDSAGKKAALRAYSILRDAGVSTRVIVMTPYKDPDEFIKNLGADAFKKRINEAESGFMFSVRLLEETHDMNTPDGRTAFLREAARRVCELDDEIERDSYADAVCARYKVNPDSFRRLISKEAINANLARPARRPTQVPREVSREKGEAERGDAGIAGSEKLLITWMSGNANIFNQVKRYISPEDFTGDLYRTVAKLMYRQYEEGEVSPAKIIDHFDTEEEHREVASAFNTKIRGIETRDEAEKALKETVIRVKNHSVEELSKALDPADLSGAQKLMKAKADMRDLERVSFRID